MISEMDKIAVSSKNLISIHKNKTLVVGKTEDFNWIKYYMSFQKFLILNTSESSERERKEKK